MKKNTKHNLLSVVPGERVFVKPIKDTRLAGRLAALGLTPGTPVEVIRKRKQRPIIVRALKTRIALGLDIARGIPIEKETL